METYWKVSEVAAALAGIGTDCIPLCGERGNTLLQIEQGGAVQALRD
jgi:hypothetical protein